MSSKRTRYRRKMEFRAMARRVFRTWPAAIDGVAISEKWAEVSPGVLMRFDRPRMTLHVLDASEAVVTISPGPAHARPDWPLEGVTFTAEERATLEARAGAAPPVNRIGPKP